MRGYACLQSRRSREVLCYLSDSCGCAVLTAACNKYMRRSASIDSYLCMAGNFAPCHRDSSIRGKPRLSLGKAAASTYIVQVLGDISVAPAYARCVMHCVGVVLPILLNSSNLLFLTPPHCLPPVGVPLSQWVCCWRLHACLAHCKVQACWHACTASCVYLCMCVCVGAWVRARVCVVPWNHLARPSSSAAFDHAASLIGWLPPPPQQQLEASALKLFGNWAWLSSHACR
jgi:hypothetical protein